MPRRRQARPSILLCSCMAPIYVGERGPLPSRCAGCRLTQKLLPLVEQMVGEVAGPAALEVARAMDRGSKRIKRWMGVLLILFFLTRQRWRGKNEHHQRSMT